MRIRARRQREALLRILTGQDTVPGATIFQVFSTTLEKLHEPIFAAIEFELDIDKRETRTPAHVDMEQARSRITYEHMSMSGWFR